MFLLKTKFDLRNEGHLKSANSNYGRNNYNFSSNNNNIFPQIENPTNNNSKASNINNNIFPSIQSNYNSKQVIQPSQQTQQFILNNISKNIEREKTNKTLEDLNEQFEKLQLMNPISFNNYNYGSHKKNADVGVYNNINFNKEKEVINVIPRNRNNINTKNNIFPSYESNRTYNQNQRR